MAQQRRGKTQARRSGGNGAGGLPGWAWLVIGIALTLLVVLAAPKLFKGGDGGFFRPTPNPDAQPQPVDEEAVVDPEADAPVAAGADEAPKDDKATEYDFYRLLPGQEVPVSDAELAASEKAEQAERARADERAAQQTAPETPAQAGTSAPLPAPVAEAPATATPATPSPSTATPATAPASEPARTAATPAADNARYLLQAGAFEASGQAEEVKAKIAMLGLGARVESASIRGKTVYRVRMGPYGTATDLAEAKRKLASGGLPAIAIKTN